AFNEAVDLVREPTLAPLIHVGNLAALIGDDVGETSEHRFESVLLQVRPEDDHSFIRSHAASPPPFGLWSQQRPRPRILKRPEQGYRPSIITPAGAKRQLMSRQTFFTRGAAYGASPVASSKVRWTTVFTCFSNLRRGSMTTRPHPRHLMRKSMPVRSTSQRSSPHGCGLRICTTSPK